MRAKPVDRNLLRQMAVTQVESYTALRYTRRREETPAIVELEERGVGVISGVQGALMDVFNVLWEDEPQMKEEVAPNQQYWQNLLEQAMATSTYQEIHAKTAYSDTYSTLGTVSMGESVLAMISDEDKEQLEEIEKAQQQANKAQAEAEQANAEARALAQMAAAAANAAAQAQADAEGNPQDGAAQAQAAQAQANAEGLSQQAQQANQAAGAAQLTLEQAKAYAQELANQLLGEPGSAEAEAKQTQLQRIGQSALKKANEQVQETSRTLEAWGAEPGELQKMELPEVLQIAKELRETPDFEEFMRQLGAMLPVAEAKHRRNQDGGDREQTVEFGRDLRRADPSELLFLAVPALRYRFFQRWARGELRLVGSKVLELSGKGPVVYLEDGSGSMEGHKRIFAKALGLALAHYCELERRDFVWIHFGADFSPTKVKVYPNGQMNLREKLEFRRTFLNAGGTSFQKPIGEAMKVIRGERTDLPTVDLKGKCDIVLGSDGMAAVTAQFLAEYLAFKNETSVNHLTMLMDVGSHTDAAVQEFSDVIEKVSQFTAEEAGAKVFAHLN